MRNSEHNSACERESEMLAYLYGEGEDRTIFESHLAECDACTDEFAAIAFARVSVLEWQLGEFAELPTPKFTIPYEKAGQRTGIAGWFALPGFGPAVAFASVLVIVLGGYFAYYQKSGTDSPAVATVNTSAPPAPAVENAPPMNITVPASIEPPTNVRAAQKRDEVVTQRSVKASVAQRGARINRTLTANAQPRPSKFEMPAAKKPVLSGLDDEDDKSLRLADLLDDGGV